MLLLLLIILTLFFSNAGRNVFRPSRPLKLDHDPEQNMTTPEIIAHWGYPVESYQTTTKDGYILTLHRIPHGKNSTETKGSVFMLHGLMGTSSNWITNLPNLAMGYLASDAGLDVWLGNVRGTLYSSAHTSLKPDDVKFWEWTWDEMVKYDLDAMIDKALEVSKRNDIYYVGHSQGTLVMFSKLASDSAFNEKIRKFFALAPVGTAKYIKGLTEILAKDFYVEADLFLKLVGPGAFEPESGFVHSFAETFCQNSENDQICDNIMFMLGGPDTKQMNMSRTDVFLADCPGGTSTVNMLHWLQMCRSGKQQMYDYGDPISNFAHYGQTSPPIYDISKIRAMTHLYYSDVDWLGDKQDVEEHLMQLIPKSALVETVEMKDFEHFDFVFGSRAAAEIYIPVIDTILKDIASRKT